MTASANGVADAGARAESLYDAKPQAVYLIRPDGYVLARWRSPAAAQILTALAGALGNKAVG